MARRLGLYWGGASGSVALLEGVIVQAGLMSHRPAAVAVPRSSFAGFRFPPEVIMLAVRWYLRYGLSYRDVEDPLAERGIVVESRHDLPVGTAVQPRVDRRRPAQPARRRGPL